MIKYIQSQKQPIWGFELGTYPCVRIHLPARCGWSLHGVLRCILLCEVLITSNNSLGARTTYTADAGNEINNRVDSCSLAPAQQAAAFAAFKTALAELYPDEATRPKLLGPDIGYKDPEVWLQGFLGNFSDLYGVT
jgi:hypothetical protein